MRDVNSDTKEKIIEDIDVFRDKLASVRSDIETMIYRNPEMKYPLTPLVGLLTCAIVLLYHIKNGD